MTTSVITLFVCCHTLTVIKLRLDQRIIAVNTVTLVNVTELRQTMLCPQNLLVSQVQHEPARM